MVAVFEARKPRLPKLSGCTALGRHGVGGFAAASRFRLLSRSHFAILVLEVSDPSRLRRMGCGQAPESRSWPETVNHGRTALVGGGHDSDTIFDWSDPRNLKMTDRRSVPAAEVTLGPNGARTHLAGFEIGLLVYEPPAVLRSGGSAANGAAESSQPVGWSGKEMPYDVPSALPRWLAILLPSAWRSTRSCAIGWPS